MMDSKVNKINASIRSETEKKEETLQALEDSLWIQKDAARKLGITPAP